MKALRTCFLLDKMRHFHKKKIASLWLLCRIHLNRCCMVAKLLIKLLRNIVNERKRNRSIAKRIISSSPRVLTNFKCWVSQPEATYLHNLCRMRQWKFSLCSFELSILELADKNLTGSTSNTFYIIIFWVKNYIQKIKNKDKDNKK